MFFNKEKNFEHIYVEILIYYKAEISVKKKKKLRSW